MGCSRTKYQLPIQGARKVSDGAVVGEGSGSGELFGYAFGESVGLAGMARSGMPRRAASRMAGSMWPTCVVAWTAPVSWPG